MKNFALISLFAVACGQGTQNSMSSSGGKTSTAATTSAASSEIVLSDSTGQTVLALGYASDGQTAWALDESGVFTKWNVATNQVIATFAFSAGSSTASSAGGISNDGTLVAAGFVNKFSVVDLTTQKTVCADILFQEPNANEAYKRFQFSPDNSLVGYLSSGVGYLLDLATCQITKALAPPAANAGDIGFDATFSPDGSLFVLAKPWLDANKPNVFFYDVKAQQENTALSQNIAVYDGIIALSPDNTKLAFVGATTPGGLPVDGLLQDLQSSSTLATWPVNASQYGPYGAAFSPDSRYVAFGEQADVAVYDSTQLTAPATILQNSQNSGQTIPYSTGCNPVVFSSDGTQVAFGVDNLEDNAEAAPENTSYVGIVGFQP